MRVLDPVQCVPGVRTSAKHNSRTKALFDQSMQLSNGESIPVECETEFEAAKLYNSLYLALYSRLDNLPLKVRKRGLTIYIEKVR